MANQKTGVIKLSIISYNTDSSNEESDEHQEIKLPTDHTLQLTAVAKPTLTEQSS